MLKKALMVVCILLLGAGMAFAQTRAINIVKNGNFKACPYKTVNQCVNSVFHNPQWESGEGNNGETLINVTGTVKYGNRMMSAYMQFELKPGGGFKTNGLMLDGQRQNDKFVGQFVQLMCE